MHQMVRQETAELIRLDLRAKPVTVQMVECSCGWRGEVHIWAWHLQSISAVSA
jgi:hypothetical protein